MRVGKIRVPVPNSNAQAILADAGFLLSHPSSGKGKPSFGTMRRRASLRAQLVKNLPAMQETPV